MMDGVVMMSYQPRWVHLAHSIHHQRVVHGYGGSVQCYEFDFEDVVVALHCLGLMGEVPIFLHVNPPLHMLMQVPRVWLRRN